MENKNDNEEYDIPDKGSLGLLAAGYKGIMVWRMKKLGMQNQEIKIIPPLVLGKVLKLKKSITEKPKDKDDE